MRHETGSVEVICGGMFCGKTEELLRRVRRAEIARQRVQCFKPQLDDRYSLGHVTSHDGRQWDAQPIAASAALLAHLRPDTTVVAVDEAQFFDDGLLLLAQHLAARGMRVLVAGLDMDFRGEPFGPMPALLASADDVTKLHAICMVCGGQASRTQRLVNGQPAHYDDPVILVGAREVYEPRCREHHDVPGAPRLSRR